MLAEPADVRDLSAVAGLPEEGGREALLAALGAFAREREGGGHGEHQSGGSARRHRALASAAYHTAT